MTCNSVLISPVHHLPFQWLELLLFWEGWWLQLQHGRTVTVFPVLWALLRADQPSESSWLWCCQCSVGDLSFGVFLSFTSGFILLLERTILMCSAVWESPFQPTWEIYVHYHWISELIRSWCVDWKNHLWNRISIASIPWSGKFKGMLEEANLHEDMHLQECVSPPWCWLKGALYFEVARWWAVRTSRVPSPH